MTLFRGMKRDGDRPLVGAGGLHIRPGDDVPALNDDDEVDSLGGGLSTTPDDPWLLPQFRRPESLGGTSKHPVWSIRRYQLTPQSLSSRWDSITHESVLPAQQSNLRDYVSNIHSTCPDWVLEYE